jgi:hypothetical protein
LGDKGPQASTVRLIGRHRRMGMSRTSRRLREKRSGGTTHESPDGNDVA